jgi:hypothetical protein
MATDAAPRTAPLGRQLRAVREEIVATVLGQRSEIPAYATAGEDAIADLRTDVGALLDTLCDALEHARPLEPDDVAFLREPIAHRARRGDNLADVAQGLRLVQREVYERVGALAADGDQQAALEVGARLLEMIDVATAVAAEAWTQAREVGGGAAERTELLDALLQGREPATEPQRQLCGRLGLRGGATVLVVDARPANTADAGTSVAAALGALSRAGGPVELPLAGARDDELIVLRAVNADAVDELVASIERAWRRLADRGLRLALGVSAAHVLPGGAREALEEARRAREVVPPGGGVIALPSLAPLDWMALRADAATWQLVPAALRSFLEQDAADGGALLLTFRGYVASDMNVKLAARRLHLHTNTVRYRLGRVAERTGLDLRRFEDVVALHVAARLFED